MKREEYVRYDGVELASLIRAKEVTAAELVACSERQHEAIHDEVNAIVHDRYVRAYEEAKKTLPTSPLSGVPVALKDISQSLRGERITSGSRLFENYKAPHDSNFVLQLKRAGLVFTGFTNTPEFALKNITEPKLFGPTRNPWHTEHSPGGSSGGAAAAVASGIVPIAGASDGGGSIRIPASFTSLVGLKPTRGRTPVGPGVGRNWQGAAIDFVLTRTVRDAAATLDAVQVVQPSAAFHTPLYTEGYLQTLRRNPARPLRIAFTTLSPVGTEVSEDAKVAVHKLVHLLEREGHAIEEVTPHIDGRALMRHYYLMNSGEMAHVFDQLAQQLGRDVTHEEVEVEGWLLAQAGKEVRAAEYAASLAAWDTAAIEMERLHETYDFFITPTTAYAAPKIGQFTHDVAREEQLVEAMMCAPNAQAMQDLIYDMFLPSLTCTPFTQLANLTGQPAISLPVHRTDEGLPIGVQVMASKGQDHRLLRMASFVEQTSIWEGQRGNPYVRS